ncbi:DUF2589 domain-containing protein [Azotobacter beijerinckii]|uniref:DUF2589 domain-containing protein n=1 Tax=Azotobacter beijerinckii TaxID=170623 RepID=UPI000B877619|nr:DUF2589 domain-containing protein [Azotobacter beijerinckii]
MANSVSLKDLIEALAGAVIFAQDKIEKYQISNIKQYFDEKTRRPLSATIRLPDLSPSAEAGSEVDISIPMLSLVGNSILHIKEMNVEFSVDISSLDQELKSAGPATVPPANHEDEEELKLQSIGKSIGVNWDSPSSEKMARLTLRVEAQEQTEGMARLMQRINKLI